MSAVGKPMKCELDPLTLVAHNFDRQRAGKKKINYLYSRNFSRMFFEDDLPYLASGVTNLLRVLQIQREELPYNSTYPRIKYRWSIIYESSGGIFSMPMGIISYLGTKQELSTKEKEKQHLLPRKKVVAFFGRAGWFPIDCETSNSRLFLSLIDALEMSRAGKKSDIDYNIHGYRKPFYPFTDASTVTVIKVIKRQFAHRVPTGSCDHSIKKQWIVIYALDGRIGECVLSTVWYPYDYLPTGQEAVGEKVVLTFPFDERPAATSSSSSKPNEPPKTKKRSRRRRVRVKKPSHVSFKLTDSNFPPLSK